MKHHDEGEERPDDDRCHSGAPQSRVFSQKPTRQLCQKSLSLQLELVHLVQGYHSLCLGVSSPPPPPQESPARDHYSVGVTSDGDNPPFRPCVGLVRHI